MREKETRRERERQKEIERNREGKTDRATRNRGLGDVIATNNITAETMSTPRVTSP